MGVLATILVVVIMAVFLFVCLLLLLYLPYVAEFSQSALEAVSWPLKKLFDWLHGLYEEHVGWRFYRLDCTFAVFGNFLGFVSFTAAGVFVLLFVLISLLTGTTAEELGTALLDNTLMGSFISVISDLQGQTGENFTPVAVVAIGTSAFISNFLSMPLENARWYIRTLTYVLFMAVTAALAMLLTGVFQTVGTWGYETIMSLYHQGITTFWATAGRYIALAFLCYLALMLVLMALKEYANCFAFVPICLMLWGLCMMAIGHFWPGMSEIWNYILAIVVIIGVELLQNYSARILPWIDVFALSLFPSLPFIGHRRIEL